jgi:hypothetical protein
MFCAPHSRSRLSDVSVPWHLDPAPPRSERERVHTTRPEVGPVPHRGHRARRQSDARMRPPQLLPLDVAPAEGAAGAGPNLGAVHDRRELHVPLLLLGSQLSVVRVVHVSPLRPERERAVAFSRRASRVKCSRHT